MHVGIYQFMILVLLIQSLLDTINVMIKGPAEARRFVEDFVITQLQGEELHKILYFEYPGKVLDNIFTTQGKEKPVAR